MSGRRKFNFRFLFKAIFYIFALLVAFYLVVVASGYKFDRRQKKFVETGNIYINSIPRDVKIYVDGKLKSSRAPLKIGYLLPGNYQIKIEKDGFKNWEKNLTVRAGLVTSEADVVLYYQEPKIESFNQIEGIRNLNFNRAKNKIIFWTVNRLYLQETGSNEAKTMADLGSEEILDVKTNKDLSRTLIKIRETSGKETFKFCPDEQCSQIYDLNIGSGLNFEDGKTTDNNNYPLLLWVEKNLYAVKSDYAKYYIDSGVLDAVLFGSKIYYLKQENGEVKINTSGLTAENKNNIGTQKLIGNKIENFRFWTDSRKNKLYLIGENRKVYALMNNGAKIEDLLVKADYLNFDNLNLFLLRDSSEIELIGKIEVRDNKEDVHLVARFSSDISDPGWFAKTNHLIYIKDKKLMTIEIRGSNETELYSAAENGLANFVPISQNEVIILEKSVLKKLTPCERGGLLGF